MFNKATFLILLISLRSFLDLAWLIPLLLGTSPVATITIINYGEIGNFDIISDHEKLERRQSRWLKYATSIRRRKDQINSKRQKRKRKIQNATSRIKSKPVKRSDPSITAELKEQLDWDSIVLLDEAEMKHEEDAGRTRLNMIADGNPIATFLYRGMIGRFLFINPGHDNFNIIVTPCCLSLSWSIGFLTPIVNSTRKFYVEIKNNEKLAEFRTEHSVAVRIPNALRGVYLLELRPTYADTIIHLFVTSSIEHSLIPFDLLKSLLSPTWITETSQNNSYNLDGRRVTHHTFNFLNPSHGRSILPWIGTKRIRGNRIHVNWDPSPFNPHRIHYCVVLSQIRDYPTLCSAQGDKFGFIAPDLSSLQIYPIYNENNLLNDTKKNLYELQKPSKEQSNEMFVGCIRKKTNYIVHNLKEGILYYFNVFIKDVKTGLAFPYLRTTLRFQPVKERWNELRDAKSKRISLTTNTSVILDFNVKKPCIDLTFYVIPCGGGLVSYFISLENRTIFEKSEIATFQLIKIAFPLSGRYYVHISPTETYRFGLPAKVAEVFVSKKEKKLRIPKLPASLEVEELEKERTCDSITIKWWPSPVDNEYCIFLKTDLKDHRLNFKKPNLCDVQRSLERDPYVVHSLCIQKTSEDPRIPLNHTISGLESSQTFVVNLIVRRHKGKSLPYDLTYAKTSSKCFD